MFTNTGSGEESSMKTSNRTSVLCSVLSYCAYTECTVQSGRTISADGWEEEDDVMFALVQVSCITSKHRGMHFVPGVGGSTSSRDRQTDTGKDSR